MYAEVLADTEFQTVKARELAKGKITPQLNGWGVWMPAFCSKPLHFTSQRLVANSVMIDGDR
jgi:hypothetical protein